MNKKVMYAWQVLLMSLILSGCTGLPEGVTPVEAFDINRYLGKWYEIARLDHSFERNKDNVTAEYSLRDDGGVRVINSAYSVTEKEWGQVEGKAYFVGDQTQGHLKVSFFGPFYGTYVVFELDKENYQYAFVSGPDKSYLWLLARTPTVSRALLDQFIEKSKALGFDTNGLIFVSHD